MAKKITVDKGKYTVESLYQWDINQVLEISGLSLPATPEIHFTNDTMDRAIVRRSTMDSAGIITVEIPNSLLQKPYTIKAYVCLYEGDTFRSLYQILIPVKARKKPADYTLEATDEEVYSFATLERKVYECVENTDKAILELDNTCKEINNACTETVNAVNKKCDDTVIELNEKYEEVKQYCDDRLVTFSDTSVLPLEITPALDYVMLLNESEYVIRGGWVKINAYWSGNVRDRDVNRDKMSFIIPYALAPAFSREYIEIIATSGGHDGVKTVSGYIEGNDEFGLTYIKLLWTDEDERDSNESWFFDFSASYPLAIPEDQS